MFHVGKLHPNHSCTLIQESFWITIHIYLVKQFKIESSDIFQILEYFQNFDVYFINRYLTVWGFTIVFSQVPLFKKSVRFFPFICCSCIGTFCHHKDFTGRVFLWDNFIYQETTYFTDKEDFFWQGTDTQMGPICSEWYAQSDHRKILEPPWISPPSVG